MNKKRAFRNESALAEYLGEEFKKENINYYRHEDLINSGISDISCEIDNISCWIELKVTKNAKHRKSTNLMKLINLRSDQRDFLVRKGNCYGQFAGVIVFIDFQLYLFNRNSVWGMPSLTYGNLDAAGFIIGNPLDMHELKKAIKNSVRYEYRINRNWITAKGIIQKSTFGQRKI